MHMMINYFKFYSFFLPSLFPLLTSLLPCLTPPHLSCPSPPFPPLILPLSPFFTSLFPFYLFLCFLSSQRLKRFFSCFASSVLILYLEFGSSFFFLKIGTHFHKHWPSDSHPSFTVSTGCTGSVSFCHSIYLNNVP